MKHLHTFESFLNEQALFIIDFAEYVRPDYVEVSLSDGRKLKIERKNVKGGQKMYQAILQALDSYNSNPKAKQFMDGLVNAMATELDK
jgi:hypothetical protein